MSPFMKISVCLSLVLLVLWAPACGERATNSKPVDSTEQATIGEYGCLDTRSTEPGCADDDGSSCDGVATDDFCYQTGDCSSGQYCVTCTLSGTHCDSADSSCASLSGGTPNCL